jgi:hypothetical protein
MQTHSLFSTQPEIMPMKCETFREKVLAVFQNMASKRCIDKLYGASVGIGK